MERNDELYHYGVLGMKWGVHRATRKAKNNTKLINESNKYNIKSAKYNLKSAKRAAKDIGEGFATKSKKDVKRYLSANKRAAKYNLKSAKYKSKASKTSDRKSTRYSVKSDKYAVKSSKNKMRATRLSGEYSTGSKGYKYATKSDRYKLKSTKNLLKISRNKAYIQKIQQKIKDNPEVAKQLGEDRIKYILSLHHSLNLRNDELYHYGVLGMKWGVRKNRSSSVGSSYRAKKKKASEAKKRMKKYEKLKKQHEKEQLKREIESLSEKKQTPIKKQEPIKTMPSLKTMTDDELRNRINRLQMEETYSRLTADPRKEQKKSAGKEFINAYGRVLSKSAQDVAGWAATAAGKYMVQKLVAKKLGEDKAKEIFGSGGKKK